MKLSKLFEPKMRQPELFDEESVTVPTQVNDTEVQAEEAAMPEAVQDTCKYDPAVETAVKLDSRGYRVVHPYIKARDKYVTQHISPAYRKVILRILSEFVGAEDSMLTRQQIIEACPRIADFLEDYNDNDKLGFVYDTMVRRAGDYGYSLMITKNLLGAKAYKLADVIADGLTPYVYNLCDSERSYVVYQALIDTQLVPKEMAEGLVCINPNELALQHLAEALADGRLDSVPSEPVIGNVLGIEEGESCSAYEGPSESFDAAVSSLRASGAKVSEAYYEGEVRTIPHVPKNAPEYKRTDEAMAKAEKALVSDELVANPMHYSFPFSIEQPTCARFTGGMHFFRGNCFKYVWRAGRKGDWRKGAMDIDKAMQYMDMAAEATLSSRDCEDYVCADIRAVWSYVSPMVGGTALDVLRWECCDILIKAKSVIPGCDPDGTWCTCQELKEKLLKMRALIVASGVS